jgi:hypothetical protein
MLCLREGGCCSQLLGGLLDSAAAESLRTLYRVVICVAQTAQTIVTPMMLLPNVRRGCSEPTGWQRHPGL